MDFGLSPEYLALRKEFREFAKTEILPFANKYDRDEVVPDELIKKLAQRGYLGGLIPAQFGGKGYNQIIMGILNEEIGRACSSVRSLITVHTHLVAESLVRWGTAEQKQNYLPKLADGSLIAAFGLSEPLIGSDAKNITTAYREEDDCYVLNGVKKWITYGQRADLVIIIARNGDAVSAFFVERTTPGYEAIPIKGMMGTRASMLAEIHLKECKIPKENLFGRKGMGFVQIANNALTNGRFSVACGSVGIARACLEESIAYAKTRIQFGVPLKDHQLIKRKISNMVTDIKAARLLCYNAGYLRDTSNPNSFIQTSLAKYFASKVAVESANEAVQIHGAMGCYEEGNIQRYYRDAKVMEIIEGSTEIQQVMLSDNAMGNIDSILDS